MAHFVSSQQMPQQMPHRAVAVNELGVLAEVAKVAWNFHDLDHLGRGSSPGETGGFIRFINLYKSGLTKDGPWMVSSPPVRICHPMLLHILPHHWSCRRKYSPLAAECQKTQELSPLLSSSLADFEDFLILWPDRARCEGNLSEQLYMPLWLFKNVQNTHIEANSKPVPASATASILSSESGTRFNAHAFSRRLHCSKDSSMLCSTIELSWLLWLSCSVM